ncbi:hypothetical protein CAPTEDRAFT_209129 [Capitella teleta]|uniref:Uncharacterized protein n=1 Tax=Capitella teleta TaxID=283909 RepID=R7TE82_CAPTE|nr:hypothetical protein CAPTEDRAFT_209129 [Capitella teleta]|eukprot:ELT89366.1 hypothetical protein CAPTEDRAFT_209129 [Capitella teleta]
MDCVLLYFWRVLYFDIKYFKYVLLYTEHHIGFGQGKVRKSKKNPNDLNLGTGGVAEPTRKFQSQSRGRDGSMSSMSEFRNAPQVTLEPTYKMEPDKQVAAREVYIERRIQGLLEGLLESAKYDPESAPGLSVTVANAIRNDLKSMETPRYKLICHVTLAGVLQASHI